MIKHALEEKFLKTDFVFAHQVNSNKMENASICHHAKLDFLGMEKLALLSHVHQVLHLQAHAAVVKPQSIHALQVHIGMDIDVFILPTSAQLV